MLTKAAFIISLIIFTLLSSLIDLPPGTLVTNTLDLSIQYSNLLTTNLLNGVFFSSIITLATFLLTKNTKQKYTQKPNTNYEIETLIKQGYKPEPESNLIEIPGIGPKRATELEYAGVKTISDLAKRSPKHLSEKTGIPITQISKWIIEANKLKKQTQI